MTPDEYSIQILDGLAGVVPTSADWWFLKELLRDRFREIERFIEVFQRGHESEADAAVERCRDVPAHVLEHKDPLADELYVLASCNRIASASALLSIAATVEATVRGGYAAILDALEKQAHVSVEQIEEWRANFGQGGLKEMVRDLSLFRNNSDNSVDWRKIRHWSKVNDIRCFCNCFKHADGVIKWRADKKLSGDHKRILAILKPRTNTKSKTGICEVEFERVQLPAYSNAARSFCLELLIHLERLLDGSEIRP